MPKIQNHVHKFKRHTYSNGTRVFFCTLGCTFKIETPLAVGHKCICNICNKEFIMDEYTIKLARPHCRNCGKTWSKDENGKRVFANKQHPMENVAADLANRDVNSLRERLSKVVTMERDPEDI